jgi:hypothetical protein
MKKYRTNYFASCGFRQATRSVRFNLLEASANGRVGVGCFQRRNVKRSMPKDTDAALWAKL